VGNSIGAMANLPTCSDAVYNPPAGTPPTGGGGGTPTSGGGSYAPTATSPTSVPGTTDTTVSGCQCLPGVYYQGYTVRCTP
jgi:hypothetical protein